MRIKPALYAAAGLVLVIAGYQLANWYRPPTTRTLYRAVPVPYIAERSTILVKSKPEERVVQTVVYRPAPKEAERLGVGSDTPVLTAVDVKPLPYGGTATVTLADPTPEVPFPEAKVVVKPKPTPFWELTPARSLSGWVGVGGTDGFTAGRLLGAEVRQGLFRSGAVEWDLRAGVMLVNDRSSWYAAVGGTVRF